MSVVSLRAEYAVKAVLRLALTHGGQPVQACQTPVSGIGRRAVVTIEGLSADGSHPLQKAWCELDVAQCGYCQAGQLMTAAALLTDNPAPTDDDIDNAMAGNLCRCGTYLRIRAGIHHAAERLATGTKPEAAK